MGEVDTTTTAVTETFRVVLIKPSHYDDDGYVIQWAALVDPVEHAGGALRPRARLRGSGACWATTSRSASPPRTRPTPASGPQRIAEQITRKPAAAAWSCWSACRRNQFPRARRSRAAASRRGHPGRASAASTSAAASRCCRRCRPSCRQAMDLRHLALRRRGRRAARRAAARRRTADELQAALQLHEGPAGAGGQPRRRSCPPTSSAARRARARASTPAAAARSCAASARSSTCRGASRARRTADDVERLVRANLAQGVHSFFITDDNFARNQNWEAIFDRLIKMREEEGLRIQHHRSRSTRRATRSAASSRRRGAPASNRVFIGLENINPESLKARAKARTTSPSTARCCRRGTASAR